MQTATFLSFYCLSGNQVAYVNHIPQLTDILGGLHLLKESLGFLIQKV